MKRCGFIESNKRNSSKYVPEERLMVLRFSQVLGTVGKYKHVNQWK